MGARALSALNGRGRTDAGRQGAYESRVGRRSGPQGAAPANATGRRAADQAVSLPIPREKVSKARVASYAAISATISFVGGHIEDVCNTPQQRRFQGSSLRVVSSRVEGISTFFVAGHIGGVCNTPQRVDFNVLRYESESFAVYFGCLRSSTDPRFKTLRSGPLIFTTRSAHPHRGVFKSQNPS